MIKRSPEFYKKRKEYRRKTRELLPPLKQLEYPTERPEINIGVPAKELLKLRSSQQPEDKLFIKTLRMEIKKRLKKEIAQEELQELENLRESAERERKSIEYAIFTLLAYEQGLRNSDWAVRQGIAQTLYALASINLELYIKLYEQGLRDSDWAVRYGTAQSLFALAPVNPELAAKLYEQGLRNSDWDVRQGTAQSLSALAPVNPELYIKLYEQGLRDSNPDVRRGTAQSLSALAPVNPELAAKLYEQGLRDSDWAVRQGIAQTLYALASINLELYIKLYEQGLRDSNPDVRYGTAQSLSALAPVNPELYVKLYEQGLRDSNPDVRYGTAQSLSALAPVNPELYVKFYEQGLRYSDLYVRGGTAESLSALAPVNPELYVKFYEQGLKDRDSAVRGGTAESLSALAPVNPELAAKLYEQGLRNSDWYVRRGTAQSLFALAPVNPELYVKFYEQGLKDRDSAVRGGTAESLSALAPVNPELAAKLYEQGLRDSDSDVRRGTAQSLSALAQNADFSKLNFIEPIIQKHQVSNDEKFFIYARIKQSLSRAEDFGNIILHDIPTLRAIKEYARTINPHLPEDKQTTNLDAFFDQNQIRLAKLFGIDRDLSQEIIIQKMQHFGFPRLERTLALADTLDSDTIVVISSLIRQTRGFNFASFEKILELSDAYNRMGLQSRFLEIIKELSQREKPTPEKIIQKTSRELLEEFSKKLGIESEITPEAFGQWNLEYLSKLFFAERNFEEESRDALKLIVKATFQGGFRSIILNQQFDKSHYTEDELEAINEIQKHNQNVRETFQNAGINYDTWLSYPKTREFTVGVSAQEREARFDSFTRELSEVMINVLGSRRERKPGILSEGKTKELWDSVFKKYGIKFQEGELTITKGKLSPFDLQKPLEEVIAFLEEEMQFNPQEALGTNLDHLRNLLRLLPDLQKEAKQKGYQFQIKLWDRQPGYDIFQGNYTHCCIAVENFNRAAILDYLVDTGINVIEVKDVNTNQTIAQTFIFMAENQEKETIAILDNIEINNDYRGLADAIRQQLFTYIADFVGALVKDPRQKIDTVLLGTAYNDVETGDLLSRTEVIRKIGGPGPQGTQYLDSFGSAWVDPSHFTSRKLFVALDNLRERKSAEKSRPERRGAIEIISRLNEDILQDILSVEQESFPIQMQSDAEDLRQTLENPNGIQIVIRSQEGEVIGYLSSKPQKDAYEELKHWDPEIHSEDRALYVESIAIKPEARNLRTFLDLVRAFIEEVKKKGYTKITMHARIAGDLAAVLQKRYGAKAIRKIENWHNFGEPFEYLEINLSE